MTAGAVTLADLFRVLSAIQGEMTKLATRLEVINSRNEHADDVDRDHETRIRGLETAPVVSPDDFADHEKRLRAGEAFRWKLIGAALAVGALSGAVAALIVWALTRRT